LSIKDKPVYIVSAEETYHYGQVIYEEGSSGDWVYVILSGLVEVSKQIQGKKYIIEILQAGDVFGVLEYIGRIKRTTTIRSIGVTTMGLIDREFLDREYNQLSVQLRDMVKIMTLKSEKILNRFSEVVSNPENRAQKTLPLVFSDGENAYRAHTVDVSAKGLFIVTERLLSPGQEFLVKLQLPDRSTSLQIKCEVLWNRERNSSQPKRLPGMGVKFIKISKNDYQILRDFIVIEQPSN
jgi:CRP-like cAMP-binding protein